MGFTDVQVYCNICRPIIKLTNTLEILSYVLHPRYDRSPIPRPSWIPRWNKNLTIIGSERSKRSWNACLSTEAVANVDEKSQTITTKGIRVDTISEHRVSNVVKSLLPSPWETNKKLDVLNNNWKEFLQPTKRYTLDKNGITAYATTLTCSLDIGEKRCTGNMHYEDFLMYMKSLFGEEVPLPDFCRKEIANLESVETKLADYWRSVNQWSYSRAMFVSESGYIGQGPRCLQTGDIICILYGGIVPFILRPEGHNFLLVGEAYVYGIMDGEAVQNDHKWGMEPEEFVIV